MTTAAILGFILAMFILAASPGPGVFATVAHSLTSGSGATVPLILGIVLGDICYLLFAVFGLAFVAQSMGMVFTIIKLLGGVYLVFLGFSIWRSEPTLQSTQTVPATASWYTFASGLLISLSNPKVILFYCAFLPTFVDLTSLGNKDVLLIILLVSLVLSTVLFAYSLAAGQTRKMLNGSKAVRWLNRTAGSVMALTGIAIAVKS
jgi:threonine/homoserine/homoserine lactone efflux protein